MVFFFFLVRKAKIKTIIPSSLISLNLLKQLWKERCRFTLSRYLVFITFVINYNEENFSVELDKLLLTKEKENR